MAKHEIDTKTQSKTDKRVRKPYHAPALKQYGDFGLITGVKGGTKADGGPVPKTKV
jgi:hypothetical protein